VALICCRLSRADSKTSNQTKEEEIMDSNQNDDQRNWRQPFEQTVAPEDDWTSYEAVNDPATGKKLPNEGHATDDDWDDYEAVNDPASGKRLPNEGHAAEDDDWDDYEAVNDPASGKKLPNEGHAIDSGVFGWCSLIPAVRAQRTIYVTQSFENDVKSIYGDFTSSDYEYPTMGITIQGAPIFVECRRFPDSAIIRGQATDQVQTNPAVYRIWKKALQRHGGKCRRSTVHIHPMNLPTLSMTDIRNFDSLRQNPEDPSTFPTGEPYPVILVNLNAIGGLDLLGFWVTGGTARKAPLQTIPDHSLMVSEAWRKAQPMPFFSEERKIAQRVERLAGNGWQVTLGVNSLGAKALLAKHSDGRKVLLKFDPKIPFGLKLGATAALKVHFEEYVDWSRLLNDLVGPRRFFPRPAQLSRMVANQAPAYGPNLPLAANGQPTEVPVLRDTRQEEVAK